MMRKYVFLVALVIYIGIIFYFSSQPSAPGIVSSGMSHISFFDKILHMGEYFFLAVLIVLFFKESKYPEIAYFAAVFFSIIIALFDESHQAVVPGRDSSFFDFLADSIGAFIVSLGYYLEQYWTRMFKNEQ